jgi:hypothetical protein
MTTFFKFLTYYCWVNAFCQLALFLNALTHDMLGSALIYGLLCVLNFSIAVNNTIVYFYRKAHTDDNNG